jgi:hypothetical protein
MADSDFAMLREAAAFAMGGRDGLDLGGGRSFRVDASVVLALLQQRDELLGVVRELNLHLESLIELGCPGPASLIESTLAHIDGSP